MASYRVLIKPSAAKELVAIPKKPRARVIEKIRRLAIDPGPQGSEKLTGEEKYPIRQGDYRTLYSIEDDNKTVTVMKIGHQRDVYRK